MNILIIEDESLTSDDLADTIRRIDSSYQIAGQLYSVAEAISFLETARNIDLIFSDIQLSDGLSFDIFQKLRLKVPVIFCTAYDEYALRAFEANGIDYILKPFDQKMVARSLEKFRLLKSNPVDSPPAYQQIIDQLGSLVRPGPQSVLSFKGDKITPVRLKDICLAYVEDEKVSVITGSKQTFPISLSMEELEQKLGPGYFRANRQVILSREIISEVNQYLARKLLVKISIPFPEQILVSKARATEFLHWLQGS